MIKKVKAALIIIGDEILSGRTHDANLNYIAKWLGNLGIILDEVRVIPDDGKRIQDTVNSCRSAFDYVFTTGGIGPTHDDITALNVSEALGVRFLLNEEARKLLEDSIGKQNLTDARLRMAMIPEGARLIKNPISGAPGFQIENVIVLAGIPVVMQSMLLDIENRLSRGSKITSEALHVFAGESHFAKILEEIEQSFDYLSIGSYPFNKSGSYGASFVLRSQICSEVTEAKTMLITKIEETGTQWFSGEASKF